MYVRCDELGLAEISHAQIFLYKWLFVRTLCNGTPMAHMAHATHVTSRAGVPSPRDACQCELQFMTAQETLIVTQLTRLPHEGPYTYRYGGSYFNSESIIP